MRETVLLAREHGVAVGAHPGFPDRDGFGRRELQLTPREVEDIVVYQVGALTAIAAAVGERLRHIKPHGALFNIAARDRSIADAIARAIVSVDRSLILFGLRDSELTAAGEAAGLRIAREAFADRAYRTDGTLLPRSEPGAVIDDPNSVLTQVLALAADPTVDTICVHGDTPGAADLAARIRDVLMDRGIDVKAPGSAD
jgi:UPF0271 protein